MKELRLLQRIWIISLLVVSPIGILLFSFSPTQATDLCGVTITADTKLDQDLNCPGDGIIIGADDITLDCDGHTITGGVGNTSSFRIGTAVFISSNNNVTVKNCNVTNFNVAFNVNSSKSSFKDNTANNNDFGFEIIFSSNNTFTDNEANGNIDGIEVFRSSNNTFKDNTMKNNTNGFLLGSFANNNVLEKNTVNHNIVGIEVGQESNNNTLKKNTANNNHFYGIETFFSNGNTIMLNTADNNDLNGFSIFASGGYTPNLFKNNEACNNGNFDAIQFGPQNIFKNNSFCTTSGI